MYSRKAFLVLHHVISLSKYICVIAPFSCRQQLVPHLWNSTENMDQAKWKHRIDGSSAKKNPCKWTGAYGSIWMHTMSSSS